MNAKGADAQIRHTILIICLMTLLPAFDGARATSPTALNFSIVLHDKDWVALRFNHSAGADLRFQTTYVGCSTPDWPEALAHAYFYLHERFANSTGVQWDGDGALPGLQVGANRNVAGQYSNLAGPAGVRTGNCGSRWGSAGSPWNDSQWLAEVLIQNAPIGWYNVSATWTTGVTSWDVVTGHGLVHSAAEFPQGVSASAWTPVLGVSTSAALHDSYHSEHDTVGYFLGGSAVNALTGIPQNSTSSCTQNGERCPIDPGFGSEEFTWLRGKGPTDWNFDVHASELGSPEPILAIAELPDDTWLTH